MVRAFQAKQGEISPVVETPDLYLLARLDSVRAAGLAPLAAVRGDSAPGRSPGAEQPEGRRGEEAWRLSPGRRDRAGWYPQRCGECSQGVPYNGHGRVRAGRKLPFNGNTAIGTAFGLQLSQVSQPVEGEAAASTT